VVIFSRDKDFGAYRPVGADGKVHEWVDAYFSRQETWSVIGLAGRFENESMRRLIFHEGVHWFLSASQRPYPMWFDEGLAELFSTFIAYKGTVTWGHAIDTHVTSLRRKNLFPLKRLLLVSPMDRMFNENDRTSLFYAESWALVHYLVFGQRKVEHGSLNDFLSAFYGGMSTEEAFKKSFGMDFEAMESALDAYLSGGKYRIYSVAVSSKAKVTTPFLPASPALVQVALSQLAYSTGRKDLARKHAEEAVRLDPRGSAGYKMLAVTRQVEGTAEQFFEAADKAIQLGAKDAEALWLLAMAKLRKASELGGVPSSDARQIANLLEKAINLLPTQKSAYLNLATVVPMIEHPNEQDERFLDFGGKLFPDEQLLLVGQAQLLRKKGNKEKALKILVAVLEKPGLLPALQWDYFKKIKCYWDFSDTMEQAMELMQQKKYKDTLPLLDALLLRQPMIETRGNITQMRGEAWAFATLQDANVAQKSGRIEEAARLYQSILDGDGARTRASASAEQALQKLKTEAAAAMTSGQ
jgi:tetratricopeptide (TPR) repeat protein